MSVKFDDFLKEQLENREFHREFEAFQIESDSIRQNRIPPDIEYPAPEVTREGAMQAFMALRNQAKKDFPKGMSMEEIDEEIQTSRYSGGEYDEKRI